MYKEDYLLIDLERSIQTDRLYFWKAHNRGYTAYRDEAGRYTKEAALDQVKNDFDNRTVAISEKAVEKIIAGK